MSTTATATDIPIIDAHIHLYPEAELASLAWCTPENPLAKQHSVAEYKADSASESGSSALKGFILVETDRKHDLDGQDGSGWAGPLQEMSWVKRVALGQPREGEGHGVEDAALCAALVPWAPLPSGVDAMERYLERARAEAGDSWHKVKGFRYLLQDKPARTMLSDDFIDGLKLLGRRRFVFDLGVDQHRRGRAQLEEAVEMIDRAHEGVPDEDKVTFIINHMCKPDLTVTNVVTDTGFIAWRTAMFTLSKCSRTYLKLSGAFSEMAPSLRSQSAEAIFDAISPWLSVILAAFGSSRIMFASDWPVCTVGVDDAWNKWRKIVDRLCWMASFDDEQKRRIWAGTALEAYGIDP